MEDLEKKIQNVAKCAIVLVRKFGTFPAEKNSNSYTYYETPTSENGNRYYEIQYFAPWRQVVILADAFSAEGCRLELLDAAEPAPEYLEDTNYVLDRCNGKWELALEFVERTYSRLCKEDLPRGAFILPQNYLA